MLSAAVATVVLATGVPAHADPTPALVIADGVTQPVFPYDQAIRERRLVETDVDSDHDGRNDRVEVRIIRPRETGQGLRVPVIVQPSPYYAGLRDVPNHDDLDRDGPTGRRAAEAPDRTAQVLFGGYLDNYFVPRGYAVVHADSLGTGGSDGCPTAGGDNETRGMKAVVDWLTGRAAGTDPDGAPAAASWSTGRVGMIGVSYNGTLANAVAATGVPGLETIVPIAAISSWYDYYRAGGAVVAPGGFPGEDADVLAKAVLTRRDPEVCADVVAALERDQDRRTGDSNAFWADRDYRRHAHRVRASVFAVHGLNDHNVRTGQFGRWWQALAGHGVSRRVWLHQGGHADPFNVRRAAWLAALHRWFDHYLHGVRNGVPTEPAAEVETAPNHWGAHRSWPVPGTRPTPLFLRPADGTGPGALSRLPAGPGQVRSFTDDPTQTAEQLVDDEFAADPHRLAYLGPPLDADVRLSGTPRVTLAAGLDGRSPHLTALLVDYGPATRYAGMRRLPEQDCIGPGIPGDPGCFARQEYVTASTPWKIVSRGWLDVRNRYSPAVSVPVGPGQVHPVSWELQAQDHVFAAGHRIGLVLISTDRNHTLRYRAGTSVTVTHGAAHLMLPVS